MSTLVVNLFGGPGTGKSTTAAHLFALLKLNGWNVELVREWIKDTVWEGRPVPDQLYIFAKQHHAMRILQGKVDVIVTDSPLMLSLVYGHDPDLWRLVRSKFDEFENRNYFLQRVKPYNPAGRFQTEDEARDLDYEIYRMLGSEGLRFKTVVADQNAAPTILGDIQRVKRLTNPSKR